MEKRIWKVTYKFNGFETKIFIESTEQSLWNYMESELGSRCGYVGASEEEVKAAKMLGLPIYLYK